MCHPVGQNAGARTAHVENRPRTLAARETRRFSGLTINDDERWPGGDIVSLGFMEQTTS
jgi:hypothetical protein